jgi:DNA-binding CsgD family transcriptional regulator
MLQECLDKMQHQEDRAGIGDTLSNLGLVELYQGNYDGAKIFFEESFQISQALGRQVAAMEEITWIGTVLLLQGKVLAARNKYEQALKALQQFGVKLAIAMTLEGLAGVAGANGNAERAVKIFSASEALREEIGVPLPRADRSIYDPIIRETRSLMKEDEFAKAESAGRQLLADGLDQIIAYALEPDPVTVKTTGKTTLSGLTAREAEILRLLAQGLTDAQIAEKLFISPRTVNAHVTSIYSKLGVNSRAAATRFAAENGLA